MPAVSLTVQLEEARVPRMTMGYKGYAAPLPSNLCFSKRRAAWCARAGHALVAEYLEHERGSKGERHRKVFAALLAAAARREFDLVTRDNPSFGGPHTLLPPLLAPRRGSPHADQS